MGLRTLVFGLGLLLAGAAGAQSGAIDARSFEQLSKAQELAGQGRHDDALYILDRLRERGQLNSYAMAQLWNFYAFIYASRDEFQRAIDAYHQVMQQADAPEGLVLTAKYSIGQLHFQLEQYDEAIDFIEQWLASADQPTPTAHIMLAQAYYQKQELGRALKHVDTAITLDRADGKAVQESWLRMKALLHYSQQDYARTAETYEELVRLYPKLSYLKQLAGMYSELGRDAERLATFDAVYEAGGLQSEGEILNLAYMWLGDQAPYKAGRIIETNMQAGRISESTRNVETLANAWAQANAFDKAVPTLQRAAELSGEGIYHARLAGVHFNAGDYAQAAAAAIEADRRGGLKNPAGNLMLLGMAYFNQKDYENALQAFRRAKQDKASFSAASKWESYTLKEVARLRAIEQNRLELYWRTHQALEATENNKDALTIGE